VINIAFGEKVSIVYYYPNMKLGWTLGRTENLAKVRDIMMTPGAGEITERELSNGYLILQAGIPEVEEFISRSRR
jgi:glutamyl-tRNA(Gln) amidotransferase subunit D